jgi:L-ascorbate metabolism protein UlaG (beta-lactamase superfamily)
MVYRQFGGFFRQYQREMAIPINAAPQTPDPRQWPDKGLHAAWLGHSTVLLKVDGYTLITDPVFSDRAGLNFGPLTLGVKRRVAPALALDALPPIDLIVNSHAHMDHLDLPSMKRLEGKRTQVVMASQTSDLIRAKRFGTVKELAWGEEFQAGPARVKAVEVNHWGARMRTDRYRGYNGYVIEIGGRRILFAGDTANTDAFRHLKQRRDIDLAIMPIGAYNPWIRYHCTPEQAWRMANEAGAEIVMPVHHRTFQLSQEPPGEPLERLFDAAGNDDQRIALTEIGASWSRG